MYQVQRTKYEDHFPAWHIVLGTIFSHFKSEVVSRII